MTNKIEEIKKKLSTKYEIQKFSKENFSLFKSTKEKLYKQYNIINNIQVPGMALRSNAGLPIHFSSRYVFSLGSET